MQDAVRAQVLVVLLTMVVAWYLPDDERVRQLAVPRSEPADDRPVLPRSPAKVGR
jgi:hypothetical protein